MRGELPISPSPHLKVSKYFSVFCRRPHGAAVTFTRMKRGGEMPMRKLSRTLSVVALLMSTVVLVALKESGWAGSREPALCTS